MAEDLSLESIRLFIVERGGKVTNHELVKHFRSFLNDPENQAETRSKFKDYVNTLAVIRHEGPVKYLVLRKQYQENASDTDDMLQGTADPTSPAGARSLLWSPSLENTPGIFHDPSLNQPPRMAPPRSKHSRHSEMVHSASSPSILQDVGAACSGDVGLTASELPSPSSISMQGPWSPDLPPGQAPQPPPRKKSFAKGKENRAGKIEEKVRQLNEENEAKAAGKPQEQDIPELSLSPGIVKERAQKLNKMASESELKNIPHTAIGRKREINKGDKGTDDEDTASVTSLDPRRREWLVKAAKADYLALVRLLKEEPKLASFKDFTSGFTALHWAAKHGDENIIKLIAGTHQANPNVRSHGGYTPLHLAAMHNHENIMELLVKTYGADANIRDYSGKRPHQYLPRMQAAPTQHRRGHANRNKNNARSSDKDVHGFIRMGSLNTKVRRTAAALAGGIGSTRIKSWGSADSLSSDMMSMPPPKFGALKKKKAKKLPADSFGSLPEPLRPSKPPSQDSDSDSAYGFHS